MSRTQNELLYRGIQEETENLSGCVVLIRKVAKRSYKYRPEMFSFPYIRLYFKNYNLGNK